MFSAKREMYFCRDVSIGNTMHSFTGTLEEHLKILITIFSPELVVTIMAQLKDQYLVWLTQISLERNK
jgi:uncharacterized membrane protein (DUF106 family)